MGTRVSYRIVTGLALLCVNSTCEKAFAAADRSVDSFSDLLNKGNVAIAAWNIAGAKAYFRQACPPIDDPRENGLQPPLAIALCEHSLGSISEAEGNYTDAANRYQRAGAAWQETGGLYSAAEATTMMNLGGIWRMMGRLTDAETTLRQALETAARQKDKPGLAAAIEARLGDLYNVAGKPALARPLLLKSIGTLRAAPESNGPELAFALNALGLSEIHTGHYSEGEIAIREAVSAAGASLGTGHPETATYETNLALALYLQNQITRSYALLRKAQASLESRLSPGSPQLGALYSDMAAVENALGKFGLAEQSALKALAILEQTGVNGSDYVLARVNLGAIYIRQNRMAEAEDILPSAIEAQRKQLPDGRVLADGVRRLGDLRAMQKRWRETVALYGEAVELYESALGTGHPDLAGLLSDYADAMKHQGASKERVRDMQARARTIARNGNRPVSFQP